MWLLSPGICISHPVASQLYQLVDQLVVASVPSEAGVPGFVFINESR